MLLCVSHNEVSWVFALKRVLKLLKMENFFLLTNVEYSQRGWKFLFIMPNNEKKKVSGTLEVSFDFSNVKIVSINIARLSNLLMSKRTFNYCIHFFKKCFTFMKSHSMLIQDGYVLVLFPMSLDHQHSKQAERTSNDKVSVIISFK